MDSVADLDLESTAQLHMNGEMVKWSLKPKRREKGRFPIPKPTLDLDSDDEDFDTDRRSMR
ncbi:hypothetical protein CASFOL_002960 [Castilleja foliolosa]|uniref:Uncharacterized protein n=1 Tax=Castilleja foliolosa TaxID=1961234 RepID=A0ABD3EGB7_9LAMI